MIRLDIHNDGTGDIRTGHYDVTLLLPEVRPPGDVVFVETVARVEHYDRDQGWAELVRRAVAEIEHVRKEK